MPYQREIELPSKGLPYGGKIPGGRVTVKAWTARDEQLLTAEGDSTGPLSKLFDRLAVLPDGFSHLDLTIDDRFAIWLNARNLSYGSNYEFEYRCKSCGTQARASRDLDKLPIISPPKEWTENGEPEPFTCVIDGPDGDIEVQWVFLRGRDEDSLHRFERQMARKGLTGAGDPTYLRKYATQIVGINGKTRKEGLDMTDILTFVEGLYAGQLQQLRNHMEAMRAGIDLELEVQCGHCGYINEMVLPFEPKSFFRAHRRAGADADKG